VRGCPRTSRHRGNVPVSKGAVSAQAAAHAGPRTLQAAPGRARDKDLAPLPSPLAVLSAIGRFDSAVADVAEKSSQSCIQGSSSARLAYAAISSSARPCARWLAATLASTSSTPATSSRTTLCGWPCGGAGPCLSTARLPRARATSSASPARARSGGRSRLEGRRRPRTAAGRVAHSVRIPRYCPRRLGRRRPPRFETAA